VKYQRRHPYKLNEHSNPLKKFKIHIFGNINSEKIQDVTEHANKDLGISLSFV
jgi:hypothetical protein